MKSLSPHTNKAIRQAGRLVLALTASLGANLISPPATAAEGAITLQRVPAVEPAAAEKTFRVLDGFRMELLAAEPLVSGPVAMAYDENGRAYVCEMRDYPYTDKSQHKPNQENPTDRPLGRVRLLEDLDGDGRFDRSTVFAEELSWPTGVACWKGGVFVAATPDIWYLKDTNGDGKADLRLKIFTGFRKLNVQAVMNNLVWGLDNHIHGAGGSNGGQIRPGDDPQAKPWLLSRHDFRFEPATRRFEMLSGGARFGGSFDNGGNRFLCNIRNPAQHVVLPLHYLARNPHLAARSALHDMAAAGDQLPVYPIAPPEPWRVLRAQRWAGERDTINPRSELVGGGVVTSSSGITVYRGAAYPEKMQGNVFVCESAGNLFYRFQLTPDSVTFKAERIDGRAEFVASTDTWFRPVNFVNAPDGTLHVLDMYREYIEHPWSIPDDIHAAMDLESGRERGRIYRLTPPGFVPGKSPRLGRASTAELVATLENPNSWWRETAQRLLVERQDQTTVPLLRQLLQQSSSSNARLHALWCLHGLSALEGASLLRALSDAHPAVREHAVKITESRLQGANGSNTSTLREALYSLADDPAPRVRFQTAFTLGQLTGPRALDALTQIARRDAADPWIRTAVLSSVAETSDQLLVRWLAEETQAPSETAAAFLSELCQIIGARGRTAELQRALAAATPHEALLHPVATGLGEGLKRSGKSLRRSDYDAATSRLIDRLLQKAAAEAVDARVPLPQRLAAIRLLAFEDYARAKDSLASLLAAGQPSDLQRAAVQALGSFAAAESGTLLLAGWRSHTPAIRAEVINAMLGSRNRLPLLLEAIEAGQVPASQVPFARRRLLLRHTDPNIQQRAEKMFGDASASSDKQALFNKFKPALTMKSSPSQGQKLFETACATCHRLGSMGQEVGPNLATIQSWNPEQVLLNIIDPNREVAPNFLGYSLETRDGRTLEGIIAEENESSVTLLRAEGIRETVFRRDIAQLHGSGLSLMPEGLETGLTEQQMADLIAFLLQTR